MGGPRKMDSMFDYSDNEKNKIIPGTLYLVATPIGNLSDISERALKILGGVDFIAAEDTRNTLKLLTHFRISKPLVSYYQHNLRQRGEAICERLQNGESCALVTDAGTPAISDPGEDLVRLCAEKNIRVSFIPGPCAAIAALALSGLFTGKFAFEGFLTGSKSERKRALSSLSGEKRTLIFYEAPHHLLQTLSDLLESFGNRKITLCRELTKLNEEIVRTTLSDAVEYYSLNTPRGEFVLVVEGSKDETRNPQNEKIPVSEQVNRYIESGLDKNSAIKAVAKELGVPKNQVYQEYLKYKDEE